MGLLGGRVLDWECWREFPKMGRFPACRQCKKI